LKRKILTVWKGNFPQRKSAPNSPATHPSKPKKNYNHFKYSIPFSQTHNAAVRLAPKALIENF
jgi:hypothetical protein